MLQQPANSGLQAFVNSGFQVRNQDGSTAELSRLDGPVYALDTSGVLSQGTWDELLFVGGTFHTARDGVLTVNHITYFDGRIWYAMETGLDDDCYSIVRPPDGSGHVMVGGAFTTAGGLGSNCTALWLYAPVGGTQWGLNGTLPFTAGNKIYALFGNMIAAGQILVYEPMGGGPASTYCAGRAFRFIDQGYRRMGSGFANWADIGRALTEMKVGTWPPPLGEYAEFVGGEFTAAGGVAANRVARYSDTSGWVALGTGVDTAADASPRVLTLRPAGTYRYLGEPLYVGGRFANAGGVACNSIAIWHDLTSTWQQFDGTAGGLELAGAEGICDCIYLPSQAPFVGQVFVGGSFDHAGGVACNNIARWDGTQWHALLAGTNGRVRALCQFRGNLIVGGDFTECNGQAIAYLAKWTGTNWYEI